MKAVSRGAGDRPVEREIQVGRQPEIARVDSLAGPLNCLIDFRKMNGCPALRRQGCCAGFDIDAELIELLNVGKAGASCPTPKDGSAKARAGCLYRSITFDNPTS